MRKVQVIKMGLFKKLFSNKAESIQQTNRHPVQNIRHTDLAMFAGSSCCPLCSLYQHRIFSISGKDKRFPSLGILPDQIHDGKCDVCNCYYGLSAWFEGVSSPNVVTAIRQSNAPLKDRRTPEQIKAFEEKQAKATRNKQKQNNT